MTLSHQISDRSASARAVLAALLVLLVSLLTAGTAAADLAPGAATAPPVANAAPPDSTTPTAVPQPGTAATSPPTAPASALPPPAPTSDGGPTGAPAPAPAAPGPSPASAPVTPQPVMGDEIQAQPAVIAAGSASAPIGTPTHDSPPPPPPPRPTFEQPIIAAPSHHLSVAVARPTLTQLASGGPFVAASGSSAPAPVARTSPGAAHPTPAWVQRKLAANLQPTLSPAIISVSVPLVGVFIGSQSAIHRPDEKASPALAPPVGPSGLGSTTVTPFGSGPLERSGGTVLLGGHTPFSTSGGGSTGLLGLNALLAATTLLAGMAWRRRSWDTPVLHVESALISSALDRPG